MGIENRRLYKASIIGGRKQDPDLEEGNNGEHNRSLVGERLGKFAMGDGKREETCRIPDMG